MVLDFDEYGRKGMEFLKGIAPRLHHEDPNYAAKLITTLFCIMREHFTPEESLQFISILPMHFKGIYVNGWRLTQKAEPLCDQNEWINQVRGKYPGTPGSLGDDRLLKHDIAVVMQTFHLHYTSQGNSAAQLPSSLKLWLEERDLHFVTHAYHEDEMSLSHDQFSERAPE